MMSSIFASDLASRKSLCNQIVKSVLCNQKEALSDKAFCAGKKLYRRPSPPASFGHRTTACTSFRAP